MSLRNSFRNRKSQVLYHYRGQLGESKFNISCFILFKHLKLVKIELITPQIHYIVTNQSPCLEGIIELIVRNVKVINLNERWPCRKRKGDIIKTYYKKDERSATPKEACFNKYE